MSLLPLVIEIGMYICIHLRVYCHSSKLDWSLLPLVIEIGMYICIHLRVYCHSSSKLDWSLLPLIKIGLEFIATHQNWIGVYCHSSKLDWSLLPLLIEIELD